MVEGSNLGVSQTLREIGVSKSSFYLWYSQYLENGEAGLESKGRQPKQFWNAIPEIEKQEIVELALEYPEKSSRELACLTTDKNGYFISESSVYRILKANGLIAAPAYALISAADKFTNQTTRRDEMWQTDFTYFKIIHWGWYYLSTVLDDYSRYIVSWKLCTSMTSQDVKDTVDMAIAESGVRPDRIKNTLRLLSDNGPSYVSAELREYLADRQIGQVRGKPYHPQTQGKIERYHRSMKNLILLDVYHSPEELERMIGRWVEYYNFMRYHEGIGNVTPADKYFGRDKEILERREQIKKATMQGRRRIFEQNKRLSIEI